MQSVYFTAPADWAIPVRVPSMGQVDLVKNYSYSIGQCANKKNLSRSNYIKNIDELTMEAIATPSDIR